MVPYLILHYDALHFFVLGLFLFFLLLDLGRFLVGPHLGELIGALLDVFLTLKQKSEMNWDSGIDQSTKTFLLQHVPYRKSSVTSKV